MISGALLAGAEFDTMRFDVHLVNGRAAKFATSPCSPHGQQQWRQLLSGHWLAAPAGGR